MHFCARRVGLSIHLPRLSEVWRGAVLSEPQRFAEHHRQAPSHRPRESDRPSTKKKSAWWWSSSLAKISKFQATTERGLIVEDATLFQGTSCLFVASGRRRYCRGSEEKQLREPLTTTDCLGVRLPFCRRREECWLFPIDKDIQRAGQRSPKSGTKLCSLTVPVGSGRRRCNRAHQHL